MGLRDMIRRSAKAVIGEVVDRVRERSGPSESPPPHNRRWPETQAGPAPAPSPRGPAPASPRAAERPGAPVREPGREPPAKPPEPREPPAKPPEPREPPAKDPPKRKAPVEEPPRKEPPAGPPPDDRPERGAADAPTDEPILTRTMAGLLAAQGYHERALRIYDHLVGSTPDDRDLASEADEVRTRMQDDEQAPPDEVAAVPVRRDALLVSWKVTDRSVGRARRVLGGDGALTARVVIVARDPREGVRSRTLEQSPVDATGEHVFENVPRGARCTASVGLTADGRFVSVAHSRVVPT